MLRSSRCKCWPYCRKVAKFRPLGSSDTDTRREQLQPHNLLEHDASLSRRDAYFGNNFKFDQGVYDTTKKYFTKPILDRFQLANARMFRMLQSKAFNPTYTFTNVTEGFSVGELLAPVVAFGDKKAVTTPRNLVNFFFGTCLICIYFIYR